MKRQIGILLPNFLLFVAGCTEDRDVGGTGDQITTSSDGNPSDEGDTGESEDSDTGNQLFDTLPEEGDIPCGQEGGNCPECEAPEHVACDGDMDPVHAIGLNCPNEPQVTVTINEGGNPEAVGLRSSFGVTNAFDPTEGDYYLAIGSGLVADLDLPGDDGPTHCNDDLDGPNAFDPGPLDPGGTLPAPIVPQNVGAVTCADDESLIGMGDCSNTIQEQFDQGSSAHDYTEVRITGQVPEGTTSFSYDFAFFSTEYPVYFQSQFNDMYVAWLESEVWTGNISFDEQGNPISLNAGFLDYKDSTSGAYNDPECMNGCDAVELHGTCMAEHAGTKWLSTTAGVASGEQVTIVFAIFDLSDSILDSYVFIDNFVWGCDGDQPPSTVPIG